MKGNNDWFGRTSASSLSSMSMTDLLLDSAALIRSRRVAAAATGDGESGGHSSPPIDYTVLSVAVMTLGLLLIVELCRHKLDQRAIGRPFSQTVLEGVYRELTTLGIVEFAIFMLHNYYKNFNLDQEQVFAKVHFALFITAIINAIMTVLLAIIASRISHRMWVTTEELQVSNYIAIREEFERVDSQLRRKGHGGALGQPELHHKYDTAAEDVPETGHFSLIRRSWTELLQRIRNPALKRKHRALLVQVRFHELRVHFLQAHKLSHKFKVSEYLKKSEIHVFKKLAHVSSFAWISLMGAVNLIYFLMGVVAFTSEDDNTIGTAMTAIYLGYLVAFVPASLVIFYRVKWIFSKIIHMKFIDDEGADTSSDDVGGDDDAGNPRHMIELQLMQGNSLSKRGLVQGNKIRQLDLFWGSDPNYIVAAFQFMQFLYALAASILVVFWQTLNVDYGAVEARWFGVTLLLCYLAFLVIMANVVPRYTLCTSLGQLVNRRRLNETLAKFKLEEALKKRQTMLDQKAFEESMVRKAAEAENDDKNLNESSDLKGSMHPKSLRSQKILGLKSRRSLHKESRGEESDNESERDSLRMKQIMELVRTKTEDLPDLEPPEPGRGDLRKQKRKSRMRSLSDGVAAMRMMSNTASFLTGGGGMSDAAANKLNTVDDNGKDRPMPLVARPKSEIGDAFGKKAMSEAGEVVSASRTKRSRPKRLKSASANVALMRTPTSSLFLTSDEKEEKAEDQHLENTPPANESSPSQSLPPLVEDIPVRAARASELSVPLGRQAPKSGNGGLANILESPYNKEEPGSPCSGQKLTTDSEIEENDFDDTDTVNTDESEGARSDFEDVPEYTPSERLEADEHKPVLPFAGKIRHFLESDKFRFLSVVFGTMVCFFFVGMRVEVLLIASHIIDDNNNTWDFDVKRSFWLEFTFLCIFVGEAVLFFVLYPPRGDVDGKHGRMLLAAAWNLVLSCTCLGLLVWAEAERCCSGGGECCPSFGERTYGGLGDIEPFTSIIALRIFRWWFGKKLGVLWRWWKGKQEKKKRRVIQANEICVSDHVLRAMHESSVSLTAAEYDKSFHDHNRRHENVKNETGTIVELWRAAIARYPDIVQKYGEFSGELLQAMLGIPIIEHEMLREKSFSAAAGRAGADDSFPSTTAHASGETKEIQPQSPSFPYGRKQIDTSTSQNDLPFESESCPLKLSGKYKRLPAAAQSVILAGKIGKPVKVFHIESGEITDVPLSDDENCYGMVITKKTSFEEEDGVETVSHFPQHNMHLSSVAPIEFVLDNKKYLEENNAANDQDYETEDPSSHFIYPDARLIRSMRRCERRLPPILDKWAVVDVVLTKYELVCFDASDVDDLGASNYLGKADDPPDREVFEKRNAVRQAIRATKGGKGLRLRDVAFGRKVVGHLELSAVVTLNVERILPSLVAHSDEGGEGSSRPSLSSAGTASESRRKMAFESESERDVVQDEYWKPSNSVVSASVSLGGQASRLPRDKRWQYVYEDRLKIHSSQGTLFLRFFSDLEDSELHIGAQTCEQDSEGLINKHDALLWCQTIARLCGADQLKQKLPHLGQNEGLDELRDFLEVPGRLTSDEGTGRSRGLHRYRKSVASGLSAVRKPVHARYASADWPHLTSSFRLSIDSRKKPEARAELDKVQGLASSGYISDSAVGSPHSSVPNSAENGRSKTNEGEEKPVVKEKKTGSVVRFDLDPLQTENELLDIADVV